MRSPTPEDKSFILREIGAPTFPEVEQHRVCEACQSLAAGNRDSHPRSRWPWAWALGCLTAAHIFLHDAAFFSGEAGASSHRHVYV